MNSPAPRHAGIGAPLPRTEDMRFVTGRGRYVDDIQPPGTAFAVVVRSPHAHAIVSSIDIDAAKSAPGVLAVLTAADVVAAKLGTLPCRVYPPPPPGKKPFMPPYPLLTSERVRHVGDRVALVVAESRHQARDAAEMVAVDYEPLPAVVDAAAALEPSAPVVWDGGEGNLCFLIDRGDQDATDAAFAGAAHVVSVDNHYPRVTANAMEPRAALGLFDEWSGRYTLYASTQQPHRVKEVYAAVLGVPEDRVHVIAPDVGGGFGMKGSPYAEDALVLWAARKVGRPVKWTSDRAEALLSDNQGRDHVDHGELAIDADGGILGLRITSLVNIGAYLTQSAGIPAINVANLACGDRSPAMRIAVRGVLTNTTQISPYRGTGRPEVTYLLERLVDKAAATSGIDPAEIRRRNLIAASEMPSRTPGGTVIDVGDFHRVLDRAVELADWSGFTKRRRTSEDAGRRRGIGMGFFAILAGSAVQSERMDIRIDRDATVVVHAGTFASGQGHETMYAQMVCDWLNVPFEKVRVVQGDTDQVMTGRGTFAARSMMVGGAALRGAADAVIAKASGFAAHMLEIAPSEIEFREGVFRARGTNRSVTLAEVARQSYAYAGNPPALGVGVDGSGGFVAPPTVPNGCVIVEVEVDLDTGLVTVDRCTSVDDCGVVINPLTATGQIHGAMAQAFGEALVEEIRYDSESGQPLTGSFMDYGMPRADLLPSIVNDFVEIPATSNPLGVKGVSEGSSSGAPPAIANAVINALRPLGVTDIALPLTPQRVWAAIQEARTRNGA